MQIISTKFPNSIELDRVATLHKFQKLYDNEQYAVLGLHEIIKKQYKNEKDIIYLSHSIPARISDFYGDFVSGDIDKMVIKAGTGVQEQEDFVSETIYENDLKEKIEDIATGQSEFGFVPLLGWLDNDGIYHIDEIPQDQYFPQSDGSVIFATWKKDPSDNFGTRLLLLTVHYYMEGDDCVIERQAWTTDEKGVASASYDLQTMAQIMGKEELLPREVITGLGELPIRQIDNLKKTKWGFGKSDYVDIIPNLAEVNERITHIATQLLKNLDAKMVVPKGLINKDGKMEIFEAIGMEKEDVKPEYLTNTNTLLVDAREHILFELKSISFASSVPMWELLKSNMPDRVESLRIQLFETIRKTDKKRAKIKRAINDLFRIGFKMKDIAFEQDIDIEFSDVLPVDELTQAQTEAEKVNAGLSSKKSAIIRLEGGSAEDADKELQQINNENAVAGLNPKMPPVIGA